MCLSVDEDDPLAEHVPSLECTFSCQVRLLCCVIGLMCSDVSLQLMPGHAWYAGVRRGTYS